MCSVFEGVAGDQLIPVAASFEHALDDFSGSALAAFGVEDDLDDGKNLGCGVAGGEGQRRTTEDRKVGKIVTDEGDAPGYGLVAGEKLIENRAFVAGTEHDVVDPELGGTLLEGSRSTPGKECDLETGALGELEPEAVTDIELFDLLAASCVEQAAVGEHTVDVENQPFEAFRAACEDGVTLGGVSAATVLPIAASWGAVSWGAVASGR